jgi:hypothetical protein
VVCDRHIRRVDKDAWSALRPATTRCPGARSAPGAGVELRVTPTQVAIWSLGPGQELLATHPRALHRGGWDIDNRPDPLGRTAQPCRPQPMPPCTGDCELAPAPAPESGRLELPGIAGWTQTPAARVLVVHRTLATYDYAGGLR